MRSPNEFKKDSWNIKCDISKNCVPIMFFLQGGSSQEVQNSVSSLFHTSIVYIHSSIIQSSFFYTSTFPKWDMVSLNNIYQWMINPDRHYKFYLLLMFITSRCLYRSISPNTTSKVPMIATISANMWFFPMWSTTARWANPGALILHL